MNIRAFLSTWFGGTVLAVLLFVPAIHALVFALRVPLWLFAVLQAGAGGAPMPAFWDF